MVVLAIKYHTLNIYFIPSILSLKPWNSKSMTPLVVG